MDPNGNKFLFGIFFQTIVSFVSYLGFAVASVFDKDIRDDMNAIGWNLFNCNAFKSVNSKKVSFYKGVPVYMIDGLGGSLSFGFIGIDESHKENIDVLNHERGHNTQLMTLGIIKYGIFVGFPSPLKNKENTPWELSASILGDSELGSDYITCNDKRKAMLYYYFALSNFPFLWIWNLIMFSLK